MEKKRIVFYAVISIVRNLPIYCLCAILYFVTVFTFSFSEQEIAELDGQIEKIYHSESVYIYLEDNYDTGIPMDYLQDLSQIENVEKWYAQKNIFVDANLAIPGYPDYAPPSGTSDLPQIPLMCTDNISKYVTHNNISINMNLLDQWNDSSVLISRDLASFNNIMVGDTIAFQYYRQGGTSYKECIVTGIYDSTIENDLTMYVSLEGFQDFLINYSRVSSLGYRNTIDKAIFEVIDNFRLDETRDIIIKDFSDSYQLIIDDAAFVSHLASTQEQYKQVEIFSVISKIGLTICILCFSLWLINEALHDINALWLIGSSKLDVMSIIFTRYSLFYVFIGVFFVLVSEYSLFSILVYASSYLFNMLFSLIYCILYYHEHMWRKI